MKSIKRRFDLTKYEYPRYSDFIIFAETVTGQDFSYEVISEWFGKLVPKEDWVGCSRESLIKHLCKLTKMGVSTRPAESKTRKRHAVRAGTGKFTSIED